LERSNRRLKLLSFVVLVAIGTMGATQEIPHTFDVLNAKQINAQAIFIFDANGKRRVTITADPASDQGGVSIFQRNGIFRASFGETPKGDAGVQARDTDGAPSAALASLSDKTALIATFEPTGTQGAYLLTVPGPSGFNGLFVNQPDGIQRANVISGADGSFMQLLNPSNGTIGMFDAADGTDEEFNISDNDGVIRATIAATAASTGNPFEIMRISGANGIDRAQMQSGFGTQNGLVQTFDSSGVQNGLLGVP
jgi:hypothetical protein